MNKLNKNALDLIKSFEGLELKAYRDVKGVWTIGYGHTASAGNPIPKAGMTISKIEAEQLLLKDIVKYENPVRRLVKVPINDNQYGALVSFTYNVGEGNFAKSTLLKKLNNGDFIGASNEFAKWNKSGGKVYKGLVRRREAERVLFLSKAPSGPVESVKPTPSTPIPSETKPSTKSFISILLDFVKKLFGAK